MQGNANDNNVTPEDASVLDPGWFFLVFLFLRSAAGHVLVLHAPRAATLSKVKGFHRTCTSFFFFFFSFSVLFSFLVTRFVAVV